MNGCQVSLIQDLVIAALYTWGEAPPIMVPSPIPTYIGLCATDMSLILHVYRLIDTPSVIDITRIHRHRPHKAWKTRLAMHN